MQNGADLTTFGDIVVCFHTSVCLESLIC